MEDIEFKSRTIDMGTMQSNDKPKQVSFTFKNNGAHPFKIMTVSTSCGCTKPKWPELPIEPGKMGYVSITFNPNGMYGDITKEIKMFGNFNDGTNIGLKIKGTIDNGNARMNNPDLYKYQKGYIQLLNPVIGLDTITTQDEAVGTFYLTNVGSYKYSVTGFGRLPSYVEVGEVGLVPPGDTVPVTIRLKNIPHEQLGLSQFTFDIQTNDRYAKVKQVTAAYYLKYTKEYSRKEWKNRPIAKCDNNVIDLGTMKEAAKRSGHIVITNEGNSPLHILKVKTHCSCTSSGNFNREVAPGKSVRIPIEFDSLFKTGLQRKPVEIFTDDPENPIIKATVRSVVLTQ